MDNRLQQHHYHHFAAIIIYRIVVNVSLGNAHRNYGMNASTTSPASILVLMVSLCFFGTVVSLAPTDHRKPCHPSLLHHPSSIITSRRDALLLTYISLFTPATTAAAAAAAVTIFATMQSPNPAYALEECKTKSHNCIRTQWTAPPSITEPSEALTTLREVLNSYPKKGQASVDCNGWSIVHDRSNEDTTTIVVEYKSCVGPAALSINLGQPFIDDLKLEVKNADAVSSSGGGSSSGGIVVEVKSSSRMGSSDLFVNRKRLEYLGNKLRERGWSVPPPKYVYEKK
jgi:hypothetical protein